MGIETAIIAAAVGAGGMLGSAKMQTSAAENIADTSTAALLEAERAYAESIEKAATTYSEAATEAARISTEAQTEIARMEQEGLDKSLALQVNFLNNYRSDLAGAVSQGKVDVTTAFNQARADLKAGGMQIQDLYVSGIEELKPYSQAGVTMLGKALTLMAEGPGELTPQQQREFQRGIEAVQAVSSKVSGGGVSSRMMENAMTFGQDYAISRFNEEMARYMPFITLGETAASASGALVASQAATQANLLTTQAQLAAQKGGALAELGMQGVAGSIDENLLTSEKPVVTTTTPTTTKTYPDLSQPYVGTTTSATRKLGSEYSLTPSGGATIVGYQNGQPIYKKATNVLSSGLAGSFPYGG